jgi:hypothetical protein
MREDLTDREFLLLCLSLILAPGGIVFAVYMAVFLAH